MSDPIDPGTMGSFNGDPLLIAEELHKSFWMGDKEIHVLKGIHLEIMKGESLAIHGASGVGKTTLLHILGALDRPTCGKVIYLGQNLFERPDRELAAYRNREIGFVFQFHYLLPELSALENVMLPALIAGMPKRGAARRARELLEELGLSDRAAHRPGRLSGGEQQRVAVARAIIMNPRLILADEPTGNLDTRTAESVENLLIRLHRKKGITLVVVTHNPDFAARMDRQAHMVDGRLVDPDTHYTDRLALKQD